ncbi:actin-like ATPase domain-containing protein [Cantharellus anzutake]|uniref:actin-like ATPase domain-containing protein n=1 Tax=Cantharellus anzutake TaxID=1750568 RepID=UPI001905B896|nr:actin-like ATPase domain-containing protein [Cantharellus anzutake]KAF8328405.1 actin-like ATPase domain-containing protein [Cantharellus anzutake]
MSFRESSVVVIECGQNVIRAGRGIHNFPLPLPSVEIRACVGLRRDSMQIDGDLSLSSVKATKYLVGTFFDEAEAAGESLEIFWPFAHDGIREWAQAEALWRYVLFTSLQLSRSQNEYPVMLCVQPNLPRLSYERLAQIFFERFNAAALSIFERPLLQMFAANSLSGVVVDIGQDITMIGPVLDSDVYRYGLRAVPVGAKQCESYLVNVLKNNASLMSQLNTPVPLTEKDLHAALHQIIRVATKEGLIHIPESEGAIITAQAPPEDEGALSNIAAVLVAGKEKAVIEAAGNKKKSAAQEKKAAASAAEKERQALDLPIAGERTVTITLGKERHRLCDPLFNPVLLNQFLPPERWLPEGSVGIDEAVRLAVASVDHPQRTQLWDGIFLTGDMLKVKNLEAALSFRLTRFATHDAESQWQAQGQPATVSTLKFPAYFAEFQERSDVLAAFLGACIAAKLIFTDSTGKNFVSKSDYAEHGPTAIRDIML